MAEIHDILVRPLVNEKAETLTAEQNTYVFEVSLVANKHEIKDAVERFFSVKVADVRTSRTRGKYRRSGKHYSQQSAWKKAYVRLVDVHSLNFLEG